MRELEMAAYRKKSYYYNLEKSISEGTPMPTIPKDFGLVAISKDLTNSKEDDEGEGREEAIRGL